MIYKIITPVATEPVTLTEVKQALRIDTGSLSDAIGSVQSIAPGSHVMAASYSLVGAAVEVLGYGALVVLEAGTNGTGGTVDAKIQESDDNVTYTDWSGGAFTQVTEATDNETYEKLYTGTKRYIRIVATVGTTTCQFGVSVIRSQPYSPEDALIQTFITAARIYGEGYTRRAFATQTLEGIMEYFPPANYFELPMPPLQSITSIKYKDSAGTETTMTATTEYLTDAERNIGRVVLPYNVSWPSFTPYPVNPIRVRFIAGYTTDIPETFKYALILHVGLMFKYRDTGIPDAEMTTINRLYTFDKAGWG